MQCLCYDASRCKGFENVMIENLSLSFSVYVYILRVDSVDIESRCLVTVSFSLLRSSDEVVSGVVGVFLYVVYLVMGGLSSLWVILIVTNAVIL